jgi:hypothetical protein
MSNVVRTLNVFLVCVVVAALAGCGKREEPSQPSSEQQQAGSPTAQPVAPAPGQQAAPSVPGVPGQATAQTNMPAMPSPNMDFDKMAAEQAAALKELNQGKDIQPISLDTLKGYMPDTLAGIKRTNSEAQHVNTMGVNLATASANYEANGGELELVITDTGNLSGPMRMGLTGWATAQINSQTDTGYEKTITYQGCKAVEQYDRQDQQGTLRVFAGNRFVVEITGTGVTMETIKQAMGQIDLKKLAEAAD